MQKKNLTLALLHRPCHLWHLLLIPSFVLAFALILLGSARTTYADGIPGGNVGDPVVRAVDIAKPAVVRIITNEDSHLVVKFSDTSTVTFPQDGTSYTLGLSGSGAFISSNGDVLTADHVVNPPQDDSLKQYLDQLAAQDVANYMNKNGSAAITATQAQQELDSGQLASQAQYGTPTSAVYLSTEYTGPQSAPTLEGVPATLFSTATIEKQSSFNQEDVAIVHTSFTDTPSIVLGDSATVQQQDELTIIGFPGNADVNDKPTNLFSTSINKVLVSSLKTTDSGAQLIQVGGNVEHGDSGGPALNSSGAIVGVVSFGLASDTPGSTSFLQASNSARTLTTALSLNTTPGKFETLWTKAFSEYTATTSGHWHKAQSDFQQLAQNYVTFQAVKPYLDYATSQAGTEVVSTPQSQGGTTTPSTTTQGNVSSALLLTVGILLLVAFLAILLFAVALRRRGKKPAPALPTVQPQNVAAPRPQSFVAPSLPQQGRPYVPPTQQAAPGPHDAMTAFGAPPPRVQQPSQPYQGPATPAPNMFNNPPGTTVSMTLRAWPCGHMNRSNARFCSICGEPAPMPPPIRRIEQ